MIGYRGWSVSQLWNSVSTVTHLFQDALLELPVKLSVTLPLPLAVISEPCPCRLLFQISLNQLEGPELIGGWCCV